MSKLEKQYKSVSKRAVNFRICRWMSFAPSILHWTKPSTNVWSWLLCWRFTMCRAGRPRPEFARRSLLPRRESNLYVRRLMHTRKAILPDAKQIHELIAAYSGDGTLLPRTLPEICENVRDFVVLEDSGRIIGCGALHLYGTHLAEIRSITVAPWSQGK